MKNLSDSLASYLSGSLLMPGTPSTEGNLKNAAPE